MLPNAAKCCKNAGKFFPDVLKIYILNAFKLALNKYRILIFSTLVVILIILFRLQVVIALNKFVYLLLAN